MPVIHPALPSNGDDAIVDVYNAAITAILAVLNGGIDTTNIASVAGASIVAASIPMTAMDATVNAGWIPLSQSFTYGANNGQKEFTATTNVDLTGVLSPGMRFKFTRGTVAPTQSMAMTAASSQYATKAGPSGITFTGAFTCEASVYLTAYPTGSNAGYVVSRYSANGWLFRIEASGCITAYYESAGTTRTFTTYLSLPLNRWVHIAASITTGTGTASIYINGTSVPFTTSGAAITITQAGNLSVGALGTGTAGSFINGFLSEVRVWGVAQTQSAIQANMGLSLTGSETNLVALFQGNGNFNDKTANANSLTATNGAIATQLANPYHNVEYFFLTAISYVNPTCTLTFFGGTDYVLPNMALLSPYYATVKNPYNFPAARGKWLTDAIFRGNVPTSGSNAKPAWYKLTGSDFAIPTGDFDMEWSGLAISLNASAGAGTFKMQLDTTVPTFDRLNCAVAETKLSTDANLPFYIRSAKESVTNTVLTSYALYGNTLSGGGATSTLAFDSTPVIFKAELAYF